MEFQYTCTQKRFCEENTELLRAIFTYPVTENEEGLEEFSAFCREIGAKSLTFAEERLFPFLCEEYRALSPHDRKFCVPRCAYHVEITASPVSNLPDTEAAFCVTISAFLKRKGRIEFQSAETGYWARRGGKGKKGFSMIPAPKHKERKQELSHADAKVHSKN